MATPPRSSIFLFLLLPTILAVANLQEKVSGQSIPWPWPCPYECPPQNETRLHLFSHQFPALPNVPNPNEVNVANPPGSTIGFGQMYVHDWILAAGTNPNENVVGRLQGFHIQAGQAFSSWYTAHILLFQNGRFAGSTLEVLGLTGNPTDELSITGGTGVFTSAHGTVKFTNSQSSTSTDAIRQVDIHVFYTPDTPTTV